MFAVLAYENAYFVLFGIKREYNFSVCSPTEENETVSNKIPFFDLGTRISAVTADKAVHAYVVLSSKPLYVVFNFTYNILLLFSSLAIICYTKSSVS